MSTRTFRQLWVEGGPGEWDEDLARTRGYLNHVWVELSDGSRHRMTFYDRVRLEQTLADDWATGCRFFAEPGLVIVSEVTRSDVEAAAKALALDGYFD